MKYQEAHSRFVSAWGTLGSQWGINRTMAEIHALLLLATGPLSVEEIMEQLQISRGNASMNVRALQDWGLVQKERVPGERREFFSAEKDIYVAAQRIAAARKQRELDPVVRLLKEMEEVEGTDAKTKEMQRVVKQLTRFSGQAHRLLDLFIRSGNNWLFRLLR